ERVHIWSVLLWVVRPTSRLGPPYYATRVVRPSPPRSRESWCSRRFAPDILFPQDAATPITGPQSSLTGVQQGKRLGLRNAGDVRSGSKRLGQGQSDDRQPDSARR